MLHSSTLQSTRPFQAAEINRRYARCLVLNQNWTSQPEVRARLPGQLRRPSDAFYIPQMAPGGVCTDGGSIRNRTCQLAMSVSCMVVMRMFHIRSLCAPNYMIKSI